MESIHRQKSIVTNRRSHDKLNILQHSLGKRINVFLGKGPHCFYNKGKKTQKIRPQKEGKTPNSHEQCVAPKHTLAHSQRHIQHGCKNVYIVIIMFLLFFFFFFLLRVWTNISPPLQTQWPSNGHSACQSTDDDNDWLTAFIKLNYFYFLVNLSLMAHELLSHPWRALMI